MPQGFVDRPMTSRQRESLAQRVAANAGDVLGGLRASAATTVFQGGDLLRRGWNAIVPERFETERIISRPDVQALMTAPDSAAGTVGRLAGDVAQFAVPVSRVSRAVAAAPMLTRAAVEGATAAGVAGLQSGGDPGAMTAAGAGGAVLPMLGAAGRGTLRVASRAASGAQDGGFGGAVASAVRTVAPGEPRVLLTQALKPRNARTNFPMSLDTALPDLKAAESALQRPIGGLADLMDAIGVAKRSLQQQLNTIRGAHGGVQIDGTPIANAMMASIPKKLRLENPEAAERLVAQARTYLRPFSLDEMETLLRETNAELDGLMGMFQRGRYAAITSNPAAAALHAQGQAMRGALDDALNAATQGAGDAAKTLRRHYGALLEIEGEATRRMNVAARQQPESLSEQIGAVRAAADMARGAWRVAHGDLTGAADIAAAHAGRSTAKAIKESQTTDALIRRAFAGYRGRSAASATATGTAARGRRP